MPFVLLVSGVCVCLGQPCPTNGSPGAIAVVDGDVAVVTFDLPAGTPYQIDYPGGLEAVWLDRQLTSPAAPLTTYAARGKGDLNGDGVLNGEDVQSFAAALAAGPFDPEADFNDDSQLDTGDIPGFVEALLGSYPADGVILYIQGLNASSCLSDAAVDLLTDPTSSGTFTVVGSRGVTVVELTISPLTGPVGTPVTVTMSPVNGPLFWFNTETSAKWEGVFQPAVGDPTAPFTIHYSAAQFREPAHDQAVLLIGEGTVSNAPDFAAVQGPGILVGKITLQVGGFPVAHPMDFSPSTDAATWESVAYPDGPGGLDAPQIAGEVSTINAWLIAEYLGSLPSEAVVLAADGSHHAAVLRIAETVETIEAAPDLVKVAVVSLDSAGNEIDRAPALDLYRVAEDGDPAHLIYHNDLYEPIVFVDMPVGGQDYPNAVVLRIEVGGSVAIVPALE